MHPPDRVPFVRPAALSAALALALAATPGIAAAGGGATFTTFTLAATPPQPAGTTCPGAVAACSNGASEPQIRADRSGTFYASSENGLGGGTLAWKSTDGGNH